MYRLNVRTPIPFDRLIRNNCLIKSTALIKANWFISDFRAKSDFRSNSKFWSNSDPRPISDVRSKRDFGSKSDLGSNPDFRSHSDSRSNSVITLESVNRSGPIIRTGQVPFRSGAEDTYEKIGLQRVLITKAFYSGSNPDMELKSHILQKVMGSELPIDSNEDLRRFQEKSWRTMKITLSLIGITFTGVGLFLLFTLGKPKEGENGVLIEDDFTHMPLPFQYVRRALSELDYYKKLINEPSREKLLPDVLPSPYYQPPYTVVLELKDLLVHADWTYNTGWRFKKRPGIDKFLESLQGLYEVVIYTAELGMTVFPIIEAIDPNNLISYKLVRDATHFVDGHHVKDLSRLNRDLTKVIVVDWDSESTKFHQDNVLRIPRWQGDDNDETLLDLASFLGVIAHSSVQDVREVLRHYKEFDDPLETFKERQRQLASQMEIQQKTAKKG